MRYAHGKISPEEIERTVLAHGRREGLNYSVIFLSPAPDSPGGGGNAVKAPVKNLLPQGGAVVSAVLASACCVLPLVLASVGLGAVGFATVLEPYRPLFIAVTLVFLGISFYLTYRRPRGQACAPGSACAPASGAGRAGKIALWVITALVLGILAFPYLLAATL